MIWKSITRRFAVYKLTNQIFPLSRLYEELAVTTEAALNIQWCKCGAKPQKEKRKSLIISLLRFLFSDPLGARTQDPNIKSVVLYLLS